MKILRQFTLIAVICCMAELMRYLIPLPVPASIYGVILMLCGLLSGVIRLEQVEDAADKLIEIMPVLFIPPAVGLMNSWTEFRSMLLPLLIACTAGTVVVMAVSGRMTQVVLRHKKQEGDRHE